jgi:hypothetical protein
MERGGKMKMIKKKFTRPSFFECFHYSKLWRSLFIKEQSYQTKLDVQPINKSSKLA